MVFALEGSSVAAAELRALVVSDAPADDAFVARGMDLLDGCGAEVRTRAEAERQIEAAHRALARAPIEPHTREELTELARFVVEREF
jgi:geranylgeranyl pyrophosphate synthase